MRILAVLLIALALPFAAGCGEDEEEAGGDDAAAAQTVEVSATEFAFDPADISVDPGAVVFELANDGSAPHALEIEGGGVEVVSDTIDGGESSTLEATLEEGTYEVYCPVGDHRDRGMEGTLTVGVGGGAGASTDPSETETHEDETGETHTGEDDDTDDEDDTGETETDDDSGGGGAGGY